MFGNILGRKKEDINKEDIAYTQMLTKISKMNLTEMRSYVKNNIKDFKVSEDGLVEVMSRLIVEDTNTKQYYIKDDDMDSKKKKAFDLVLAIAENKKINLVTIELIQKFIEIYKDMIHAYDKEHKDIYISRFMESIKYALMSIEGKAAFENKMELLGENKHKEQEK